jgi:hypothetical protein
VPNIDAISYFFLAVIAATVIVGVVLAVRDLRKPKSVQLAEEIAQLPLVSLAISVWMLLSFPTPVVKALVDWRYPGLGAPIRWAIVLGAAAGLMLAIVSRANPRLMPISLSLLGMSLAAALGVLVVALEAPGGAVKRDMLEFAGWSCLPLLALGFALRYRHLIRGRVA